MRFAAVGRSDVGIVRSNNEDAFVAGERVAVVSDGVGGRPAGEVASLLAVTMFELLTQSPPESLAEGVRAIGAAVRRAGAANSLLTGMCCTLTGAVAYDDGVRLAHVGDSRAYLVRDGAAQQISEDQTLVARLLRDGEITPEEAKTHPRRNLILQAIGSQQDVTPEVRLLDVRAGDRLVLATDGLLYTDPAECELLLAAPKPAAELADALVAAALSGGGGDNVTVVVADLVD